MGCFQQANSAGTTLHGSSVIQTSVSHQRLPTTANGYPVAFQLGCTYTYTQFVLEAFPPPYLPLSLPPFTHTLFYHFGRLIAIIQESHHYESSNASSPFRRGHLPSKWTWGRLMSKYLRLDYVERCPDPISITGNMSEQAELPFPYPVLVWNV